MPHRSARQTKPASFSIPLIAALAISLFVLVTAFGFDRRNASEEQAALRARVEDAASMLARRLTWRMEIDISAGEFISHEVGLETDASAQKLDRFTDVAFRRYPHFAAVALAPNHSISSIKTPPNVEAGAPLFNLARLTSDIKSARGSTSPLVLTGTQENHLTLILPVDGKSDDAEWGAIAIVIDKAELLASSGIALHQQNTSANRVDFSWIDFALRDRARPSYLAFLGDDIVETRDPVTRLISVAGSQWDLMVVPKKGWNVAPSNQEQFRAVLIIGTLAIIIPILISAYLISERNRHIRNLKAREANLLDLSQRFNLAMEASNTGIWEVSFDGSGLSWDKRADMLHGRTAGHSILGMADVHALLMPEDRPKAEAYLYRCSHSYEPTSETYRVRLGDGTIRYLRSAGASFDDGDGTRRMTGIVWDVTADMLMAQTLRDAKEDTEIKNAELELALDDLSDRERQLEDLSDKLDFALASYDCGIWQYDPSLDTETWDARMCQLYGMPFTDGRIAKDRWLAAILPEDREMAIAAISRAMQSDLSDALVVRVPQADGSVRHIRSVGKLQTDRDGRRKLVGIAFDVTKDVELTLELQKAKNEADAKNTELEIAKSRIEHNALHDPLTLLPNRRKLDMELDRLSRFAGQQKFALLHLDLDRFKQINDTLGHAAGDAMLVYASQILSRTVDEQDLVARIGGDEFVILVQGEPTATSLAELAQRIVMEFRQPLDFEGFSCRCGVSIGIAEATGSNVDAHRILVNADLALYRAKGQGRNRFEFFTHNLHAEIVNHKRTADELLSAIENHEFTVFYQPQVCASANRLTGVEALIRWNHPHRGILTPDRFLKVADDLNVTATLDQFVLEQVLVDKMRWAAMGVAVPRVSVNVSAGRLHDEKLIELLRGLQISPGEIAFELVESIFLDETDTTVVTNLEKIKALGIDVEIDDFGTGHTSIVSLLKLKPQRLKIDRQLVMPILTSPQERALVRSIIDIARSLGLETVAEGVETFDHAAMLADLGCDLLQGYAFARPLPFDDFTARAQAGWQRQAA